MAGDDRVRHCTLCDLNVYNFAAMTGNEIRALLMRTEGRVCARLYRRADGTLLTSDCPSRFQALRRRMGRFAAAVTAALFSVTAFASGIASAGKPRLRKHGSEMTLSVEPAATPQQAVFAGVVSYDAGGLPGVIVVVRNEVTHRVWTAVTDVNGVFAFRSLEDGLYRAEITLEGFKPVIVEHIPLKRNEMTSARVALRYEVTSDIVVGAIAEPWMPNDGVTTTFSQAQINKLPI